MSDASTWTVGAARSQLTALLLLAHPQNRGRIEKRDIRFAARIALALLAGRGEEEIINLDTEGHSQ
jgi:hypothetical protein